MFHLKHFFNILTQIFKNVFCETQKKKFQNKCLLDVYIESVKNVLINVFQTFTMKYLINDSKNTFNKHLFSNLWKRFFGIHLKTFIKCFI